MRQRAPVRAAALGALFGLLALAATAPGRAQDPKDAPKDAPKEPAPKAEAVPANFRSLVVVDGRFPPRPGVAATGTTKAEPPSPDPRDRTGKLHDLVAENGLNRVVAVFTRADPAEDKPGAKLAAQLHGLINERAYRNRFSAFVVFLTLNNEFNADEERTPAGEFTRDAKAKQVRDLGTQLKAASVPLGLAARSSEAAKAWGVGEGDETVVVFYNQMQVIKRWNYAAGAVDDAAIKDVLDTVRATMPVPKR